MAILLFATPIAGLRGTVGGLTYSANGSGPYVRAWSKGPDPRTGDQSVQRQRLSTLPSGWRLLSAANKATWDTFAADPAQELTNSLGEAYYLSGYQWYVKINRWRQQTAESIVSTAPTAGKPAIPAPTYLRWATPPTTSILYGAADPPATSMMVLFWRVVQGESPGVATSGFWYNNSASIATGGNFYWTYNKTFGVPDTGYRGFFRYYRQSSEGYRSSPFEVSVTFPYAGAI